MEDILLRLIASSYTMYYMAHSAHWNVFGPYFIQYHEFFGEIYQDVFNQVDTLGEYLRILNNKAPTMDLRELLNSSDIDNGGTLKSIEISSILSALISANKKMADLYMELYKVSTQNNRQGIANYASERIDYHDKIAWMLKSSNSKSEETLEQSGNEQGGRERVAKTKFSQFVQQK